MPRLAETSVPAAPQAAAGAGGAYEHAPVVPARVVTPADAFAVLLEAEQAGLQPGTPPGALAGLFVAPPSPPVDELVDEVTRRVIDQFAGDAAREAVADKVSAIAERLVRQEIDRLKASIR